jgi:glycosyltransferase involved in cell wall biosynthesis
MSKVNTPEISIVMSVFNDSRHLRASMESILSQQDVDFEFIIMNDGSTDHSPAILSEYAARDSRIHVVDQVNCGLTESLIRGCRMARGAYVARQDADDISAPSRLALLSCMLRENASLSFVSSWGEVIGPEGETLLIYQRPADPDVATQQLLYERVGPPGHGSVMFRRDRYEEVGGYRHELYCGQDSDLWLRLGLVGRLGYAQEVLYQYRISDSSISSSMNEPRMSFIRLIDELHAARMAGQSEEPILEKAMSLPRSNPPAANQSKGQALYFIGRCLYNRRDRRARRYFIRCVKRNPIHLKAWLYLAGTVLPRIKRPERTADQT